jgi:general secretion pathway protein G
MKTQTLKQRRSSERQGFSLAELMVVIVIIGLLATAVVPRLMDRLLDAKWGKVKADLASIEQALTQFAINNGGTYPDSLEVLVEPDGNNRRYLDSTVVPKDPWGKEYGYEAPMGGMPDPRVICYGQDGSPGGEGDDRDRDSMMLKNGEWD